MSSPTTSYWCYRCNRSVRVWTRESITCPDCELGFVEELTNHSDISSRRRFPAEAAAMLMVSNRSSPDRNPSRRNRRNTGDRTPINPIIVLRGGSNDGGEREGRGFELYYDDGGGSGLRPLPASMSEIL